MHDKFLTMNILTGSQIRMARGFLKWSVRDLSEAAGVGTATISRMEEYDDVPNAKVPSIKAVYHALEDALANANAEFLPADDQAGAGVRLKK